MAKIVMACLNRALRNTWKVLSLMNFDTTELQEECSMDANYFVKVKAITI